MMGPAQRLGHGKENGWRDPVKNQKLKTEPAGELNDELLEAVSGGTDSTETNLQDDTIKDEVMLIIPIV